MSTDQPSSARSLLLSSESHKPAPPPSGSVAQRCLMVWDRVLAGLANHRQGKLVGALTACRLVNSEASQQQSGHSEACLTIDVPDLADCECLFSNTPEHQEVIARHLSELLGEPVRVLIRGAPGSSSRGRYRHAEQHPLVQQIRKSFDAEILAFEPMSEAEWDRHLARLSGEAE